MSRAASDGRDAPIRAAQPLRVAVLAARPAGLALLEALGAQSWLRVVLICTHARLPRSEDPARGARPELNAFGALAQRLGASLHAIDTRDAAATLEPLTSAGQLDLLLCVSWRFRVEPHALRLPRLGGVNLHRGKLPEYAGAQPVLRALQDGRTQIVVTAHAMIEQIDAGRVLAERQHPVGPLRGDLPSEAERLKQEILPLYGDAALRAIRALLAQPPSTRTHHEHVSASAGSA